MRPRPAGTLQTSLWVPFGGLGTRGHEVGLRPSVQPLEKLVRTAGHPKGFCNCDFLLEEVGGGLCLNHSGKRAWRGHPSSLLLVLRLCHLGVGERKVYRLAFVSDSSSVLVSHCSLLM